MITKENSGDRPKAANSEPVCQNGKRNGHCNICGQQLLTVPFTRQSRLAHVCNNIWCGLFKSPQYYTEIAPVAPEIKPHIKSTKPSYNVYLRQKKENYELLRRLGMDSRTASNMCTHKQTKLYLESIGYDKS